MEAMQHDGGVRSVVVGGQPSGGPMQAPSGTRGAEFYASADLDADFEVAIAINATAGELLPSRVEDVYISYMGVNIKDQIREGEDVPLQFLYLAADCRIFFTPDTFWNMTNLWKYAAAALSTNPEYCVTNSTGYGFASSSRDTAEPITSAPPTVSPNINPNIMHNISGIVEMSNSSIDFPASFSGQQSGVVRSNFAKVGQLCGASTKDDAGCPGGGFVCMAVPSCGSTSSRCVKTCSTYNNACGGFSCQFTSRQIATFQGYNKVVQSGFCPLSNSDCRASVTGPQGFLPTTAPSGKQGSAARGKGGTRDALLADGSTFGSIINAGLAFWR